MNAQVDNELKNDFSRAKQLAHATTQTDVSAPTADKLDRLEEKVNMVCEAIPTLRSQLLKRRQSVPWNACVACTREFIVRAASFQLQAGAFMQDCDGSG